MLPFYLLTILLNAVSGYVLAFRKEEAQGENGFSFSFDNEVFRLVLGAASIFTGLFKVLSPVAGNVPVAGDLVPALANFLGGGILVFDYYRNRTTVRSEAVEKLGDIVEKNRKIAGFISIGAAVLHFVFYSVLFL
ncbi:MAG: hypothetical protein LBP29_09050 [Treponema sp.]|jgi:hypothetical protein|nr:hypothetical protein [Treponema sp.]